MRRCFCVFAHKSAGVSSGPRLLYSGPCLCEPLWKDGKGGEARLLQAAGTGGRHRRQAQRAGAQGRRTGQAQREGAKGRRKGQATHIRILQYDVLCTFEEKDKAVTNRQRATGAVAGHLDQIDERGGRKDNSGSNNRDMDLSMSLSSGLFAVLRVTCVCEHGSVCKGNRNKDQRRADVHGKRRGESMCCRARSKFSIGSSQQQVVDWFSLQGCH